LNKKLVTGLLGAIAPILMDNVDFLYRPTYADSPSSAGDRPRDRSQGKKQRPCLNCGKLHSHNNSFHSAECCREYNQKMKDKRKNIS